MNSKAEVFTSAFLLYLCKYFNFNNLKTIAYETKENAFTPHFPPNTATILSELPELTAMAQQSLDDTDFKNHLQEFLTSTYPEGTKRVSKFDSLSATTERQFMSCLTNRICKIQTLSLLRRFLTGEFGKCRNTY